VCSIVSVISTLEGIGYIRAQGRLSGWLLRAVHRAHAVVAARGTGQYAAIVHIGGRGAAGQGRTRHGEPDHDDDYGV
jgi:hypothetical protein